MAQLLVRGLSDDIVRGLKERARARGRSVEAEHRIILEEAIQRPITMEQWADQIAGTWIGELDPQVIRDRDDPGRTPDWP